MDRVALAIFGLIAIGAVMSLLLIRYFRKKWIWFLPSLTGAMVVTLINVMIWYETLEGHVELGYILLSFMIIAIMIGNLLTTIYIILKRKKKENGEETKQ